MKITIKAANQRGENYMTTKPFELYLGDCLETLRSLPDNSVDSIVTDPPYGLSFMGKKWDYDVPSVDVWAECLRVLKPGGHLLSFAGTRTQHRMAVRIEDAGFEIRDMIAWVYGSGFPKSRNLDDEWQGWGTALKPALEPITVARKPLIGTVAANVLTHGTGALNIDGCRVHSHDSDGYAYTVQRMAPGADQNKTGKTHQDGVDFSGQTKDGRWPANLIHDGSDEVIAGFPFTKSGVMKSGTVRAAQDGPGSVCYGTYGGNASDADTYGDAGSAARFFYCAKASRKDRNEGMQDPGPQFKQGTTLRDVENTETKGNNHPTVKPTDLMAYLCRLVTPPGGVVLDPFMGSGSTGKAAMREGFQFIGCELSEEYMAIASARIEHELAKPTATQQPDQVDLFAAE